MDILRERVDEKVRAGLKEANSTMDEELSQFVLPTGEFNVLGHHMLTHPWRTARLTQSARILSPLFLSIVFVKPSWQ